MSGSDEDNSSEKASRRMRAAARELEDLGVDEGFLERDQRRRACPSEDPFTTSINRLHESRGYSNQDRGRPGKTTAVYNANGIHINSGKDVCDCLESSCPGCFFPCKKCGATKCGHRCRNERKWMYHQVIEQNPFEESKVLRTSGLSRS